jgi:hypothetical protein
MDGFNDWSALVALPPNPTRPRNNGVRLDGRMQGLKSPCPAVQLL